jgi:UDP-galactopyranose mutase
VSFDWVVVGAGFTGCTFAREMADRGASVLIFDRRDHLGGNAYDEIDSNGVLVHRYGPHIFHTNSSRVWEFLSRFTEWRPYFHHVVGYVDGKWVPIPFNLESIEAVFPAQMASRITERLIETYGFGAKVPILKLRDSGDEGLALLANFVYRKVFEDYTRKQWGVAPDQLDPSVTGRVPVVVSRDPRYFHDTYQAMPRQGYTALFRSLVDHPRIRLELGCGFEAGSSGGNARVLFTGMIDEYFGYRFGALPYRSIRFKFDSAPLRRFQSFATHNYPSNNDFTRITEMKVLSGQEALPATTLCFEYPEPHESGVNEPLYPIPQAQTRELYRRYAALAETEAADVVFAGRLGEYQYYNMDQAVARALALAGQCARRVL